MPITVERATAGVLDELADAVGSWQVNGTPVQVHPGDLGWNCSLGVQELVDSLRLWRRDDELVAAGMVDEASGLIRMAISPSAGEDDRFAEQFVTDVTDPARGVLPPGQGLVEARCGGAVGAALTGAGWSGDEPWTPLLRDLSAPVEDCGLRIETLDADHHPDGLVHDRVTVQRAAFATSTFTEQRWHAMAGAPFYRRARCVVAYDADDNAVAATTVWSAGAGRPGLIEPLGAHPAYRRRGHGRAITLAAAAELRSMGAASVGVCTRSSNVGAVAAYASAGFIELEPVADYRRPG